ncbi:serine/threonine-protein kinase Nek8-like isoform X2 [Uloborus diversus]|uniref:serine/threonine-protein kinase Nek8-like isoform X2 n=1 Tax=Uloborus diversus TaxID=327109 RepID=UPI00240A8526|nr:serine/threonine-protein kinase Nek8-like isoform X2 [Uloborus diversus]
MENYEKIRVVGRGGYGTVYLCHRLSDCKPVVLKEIVVDQMSVEERQVSMNEAKVLAMLDHPHIVPYYESFLEDKMMKIVMEYVPGGTLFEYLRQRNGELLVEKEVLHYFGQLVYTLQHLHSKLILHRDLKSQNILLTQNKKILKIGDFGISKVLSSKSKASTVVGTPCYYSPELCEGKPYNQKSDIWALGCILYELMTLKRPFEAGALSAMILKIIKGSYEPVSDIYSPKLKKLLARLLHLDPRRRPTAAQIMCEPVMINTIFQLRFSIGSIPCTRKSPAAAKASSASSSSHDQDSSSEEGCNEIDCSRAKENIWLFTSETSEAFLLPSNPKHKTKMISLGSSHKLGITETGTLITWENTAVSSVVEDATVQKKCINLPSFAVSLANKFSEIITSVSCGDDFAICLSGHGVLFSFGKASSGCLGYLSKNDVSKPRVIGEMFSRNVKSVCCGSRHALALTDENEVFSWGHGNHGCLGQNKVKFQALPRLVKLPSKLVPNQVFCGKDCSFIVTKEMSVLACGNNRHNKLAMDAGEGDQQKDEIWLFTPLQSSPLRDEKFMTVCGGRAHTAFLCDDGKVYTVGSNCQLQLGWGTLHIDYSMPRIVESLKGFQVTDISCGDYFTLALTKDKSLYCWGQCPKSLIGAEDARDYCIPRVPSCLHGKVLSAIACDSESCVILEDGTSEN